MEMNIGGVIEYDGGFMDKVKTAIQLSEIIGRLGMCLSLVDTVSSGEKIPEEAVALLASVKGDIEVLKKIRDGMVEAK